MLRRVRGRVQQVLRIGNIELNETNQSVTVDGRPVSLSQAQLALLSTFMRHPNQVLTRDQLISLTFNDDFDSSTAPSTARLPACGGRSGGTANSPSRPSTAPATGS